MEFRGPAQVQGVPTTKRLTGGGLVTVHWVDPSGNTKPFLSKPGDYLCPSLSPDGNRIAFASGGDIWTYDAQHDAIQRLSSDGTYQYPLWTRDGRYVVFRGNGGMFWTRADGTTKPQQFTHIEAAQYPWSFTADGRLLAIQEITRQTGVEYHVSTASLESNGTGLRLGKLEAFLHSSFHEGHPAIFTAGKPRPWSGKRLANVGQWRDFDLAPNGRRILALLPVDTPDPELRATFLLNFFDEIQRRVRSNQ